MTNGTMLSTNCMSETFRELRPLCVEIAREPTHSKIDGLHEYLQSHKFNNNFAAMLDYIIFPLHTTIRRRNTSLDLKLKAIKCICVLLSQTKISSFDLFQKIFQNVCLMLSSKEPGKVREMTEDDKEALVDCILTLLDSSPHVLEGMYGNEYMPSTGHCITLLLHIAENDKAKHLRVKAIKCIEKLVFVSEEKEKNMGEQLCKQEKLLSMKLASFLPGISISLVKIISGGMNQGQNVIIGALDAWLVHIQVVMNDKYLPVRSSTNSADNIVQLMSNLMPYKQNRESAKVSQKQTSGEKCLEVQKDKEWFSNTSSNLKLLIDRVITLGKHPIWKVRMALLRFCEVLLKNCYKSLQKCVPSLLETVLGFFSDEYSQISRRSNMVMDDLNMLLTNDDQSSLIQIIEENIYMHFSSLPRQIRSTVEENKLYTLHVVAGYLHVLGYNIKTMLNSGYLLKRLSHAFIQILELDLSDIKIVEQKTSQNAEMHSVSPEVIGVAQMTCPVRQLRFCQSIYKKIFKHFRSEKVLDAIVRVCRYLGYYGPEVLLLDHFLDLFRSSPASRKQVAFVINEISLGTIGIPDGDDLVFKELPAERLDSLKTCVTLTLTEYLSQDVWNIRISNIEEECLVSNSRKEDLLVLKDRKSPVFSQSLPFSELNSNIQLLCLLLEGIGVFAILLQEHFDSMLLHVLYPLMEKLGSRNATISQMAYWSLVTISRSCKYGTVEQLIGKNVDYLINSISLNLRHISLHRDTPNVLIAMLQYGDKGLIPYLEDSLDEVLNLIDYSTDEFLLSLVKVLNSVTVAINKWFLKEKSSNISQESKTNSKKMTKNTELKDFFIEHLKLKKTSLGDVSTEDIETEDKDTTFTEYAEEEEKSEVKEVPLHIKFIQRVLEKCTYFVTSKFVKVRLLVLDTIEHGILALRGTDNNLFPMIHKLWPPMVKSLSDDELVVRTRAVSVLCTMVNTSGQFMRRRVIKEAFPTLTSFLVKQQAVSSKASPIYSHTQGFKFQVAILESIGTLCRDLEVFDVDCDKVVSAVLPYLSERQPQGLQQAAVGSLHQLVELEPDLIWLSLNDLHCSTVPSPPAPCSVVVFPTVQFAGDNFEKNEYAVNVEKLLKAFK